MGIKILQFFCIFLFLLFEYPLVKRFLLYKKNYELSKTVAVIILMVISGIIVCGIYNLGLVLFKIL